MGEVHLRILYCSENYCPHDHRFLTALSESKNDIFWLRLEETGRIQENRALPKTVTRVKWRNTNDEITWRDYKNLNGLFRSAVEKINPHLIHAGPIQRVAYLPALIGFHPLLTMSWGFDLLEDANRDIAWSDITRLVLQNSDWFTSDCQTTKKIAVHYGMSESRTVVFPWGVDLNLFNPERRGFMRRQIGYENDLLIIHTRSWEPRYGVDIVLQGFFLAIQQVPNLRLFFLGGGSQEEQVRQFVLEKNLSERVHFCGYMHNDSLADYYQAGDVFLSASHIDGSSVALLESMACGCPALVSDIPANLEWITEGKQGWVFKDGDAENLAEKIVHIAQNKNLTIDCGRQARKKAEKYADWKKNSQKLLDLYNRIIN